MSCRFRFMRLLLCYIRRSFGFLVAVSFGNHPFSLSLLSPQLGGRHIILRSGAGFSASRAAGC